MSTDLNLIQINDFHCQPEERLKAARWFAKNFKPDMHTVCEADLHCHSFYSDGYNSPSSRVFEAWRRGMKSIAISDHDVVDGQREAIISGKIFGIDVIPAIEFYTDRPGIEIIGHFPDTKYFLEVLDSKAFAKICEPIRSAKAKKLRNMITRIPECFAKLNFSAEITPSDINQYVRNGASTQGDISVIMWQKYGSELAAAGLSTDVKDFHGLYTSRDDMLNVPLVLDMDISPEAFVKRIRQWGGLPGIAHPPELRKKEKLGNEELYKIICELAECGLQTLEVDGWRNAICPECGLPQTEVFEQLRQRYNNEHQNKLPLLFTNGSDDHNQPDEGLELGCGKDGNLHPEFGRYDNIIKLRERQRKLLATLSS
jgi:3',5'-nucleoside bisphosphate phosphatase